MERIAGVRVVRCDDHHWSRVGPGKAKGAGRRPEAHQVRQSANAANLYRNTRLAWLAHLDVDEFLWPARPVAEVLSNAPADAPALRMLPWEALHDPALTDDIFTARHFRRALRGPVYDALREDIFGPYAEIMHQGAVSHAAGKCFFRTGVKGLVPRIHTALLEGERLAVREALSDIALLHFHAQDPAAWRGRLEFRATKGAYRANPPFFVWYSTVDAAGIDAFYDRVQVAHPETLARLRSAEALIEADLGLRAKVAALSRTQEQTWAI